MKKLGIIGFLVGSFLTSKIYAHTQKELEMKLLREVSLGNLDGVKKAIEERRKKGRKEERINILQPFKIKWDT